MQVEGMNDTGIMDGLAMERMLIAIEGSLKVARRFQFFLWSQGALQGVLPHDILLCVYGDFVNSRFKFDVFARTEVAPQVIDELTDPVDGLLQRIIRNWLGAKRTPCLYTTNAEKPGEDALTADLRKLGCGHVMAHGAREIHGNEGSFFVFLQMPKAPQAGHAYLLDLVMPHLHMALYRMLPNEHSGGAVEISLESVLSSREIEVLRLVREGKTNQQIGLVLNISPFTVKNHMQKIMRKLKVGNRAQAVAKGESSHLFATNVHNRLENRVLAD